MNDEILESDATDVSNIADIAGKAIKKLDAQMVVDGELVEFDEMLKNELLVTDNSMALAREAKQLIDDTIEFQNLMMRYRCAIREIRTKLEVLNDDLTMRNNHSPIESITHRIKKPTSIMEKMGRLGYEVTPDNVVKHLNDVAGIRVICSFIDDIYSVADMLAPQDDITVIEIKDYIKNPKSNGYRSYHMIVEVPVFFADYKRPMRVEVQFRTIAMDFWASLEHQLRYKKSIKNEESIAKRLKACAEIISRVDVEMQEIKKEIGNDAEESANDMMVKLKRVSNGMLKPGMD